MLVPEGLERGRFRVPQLRRPPLPGRAVPLAQDAEGRVVSEADALPASELVEVAACGLEHVEELLQRPHLDLEHPVPPDQAVLVQGPRGRRQRRQPLAQQAGPRHLLDPEVERVAEAPAGRMIGAGLLGERGQRGVQGIDGQYPGAELRA